MFSFLFLFFVIAWGETEIVIQEGLNGFSGFYDNSYVKRDFTTWEDYYNEKNEQFLIFHFHC